jgi:hypothetical protein
MQFSPEILMNLLRNGQVFQSDDGARLMTIVQGVPELPLQGVKISEQRSEHYIHPPCTIALALEDGQDAIRHKSVLVHCAQGQGLPHDFDMYAEQAYTLYRETLKRVSLPLPYHVPPW